MRQFAREMFESMTVSFRHGDRFVCKPQWSIEPMTLESDVFFHVVDGHGWLKIDDHKLPAESGRFFIHRRGQTLAAGHDPQRPVSVWSIGFTLKAMGFVDPLDDLGLHGCLTLEASEHQTSIALMAQLVQAMKDPSPAGGFGSVGHFHVLMQHVIQWMAHAKRDNKRLWQVEPPRRGSSRLSQTLDHVQQHLDKRLTTASLAKHAGVTPSHLAVLFRQALGMSPSEHVRQARIARARTLLASSELPVAEVAMKVGFVDPYHFSRAFKQVTGVSPRRWRASCMHPFSDGTGPL